MSGEPPEVFAANAQPGTPPGGHPPYPQLRPPGFPYPTLSTKMSQKNSGAIGPQDARSRSIFFPTTLSLARTSFSEISDFIARTMIGHMHVEPE